MPSDESQRRNLKRCHHHTRRSNHLPNESLSDPEKREICFMYLQVYLYLKDTQPSAGSLFLVLMRTLSLQLAKDEVKKRSNRRRPLLSRLPRCPPSFVSHWFSPASLIRQRFELCIQRAQGASFIYLAHTHTPWAAFSLASLQPSLLFFCCSPKTRNTVP